MYLSKLLNTFVQIVDIVLTGCEPLGSAGSTWLVCICICPKCEIYLIRFQDVFVQIVHIVLALPTGWEPLGSAGSTWLVGFMVEIQPLD